VTGRHYHLTLAPPATDAVRERLLQHPRDEEQDVGRRLTEFAAFKQELQDLYSQVGARMQIYPQLPGLPTANVLSRMRVGRHD
jgi:hypothetical protein